LDYLAGAGTAVKATEQVKEIIAEAKQKAEDMLKEAAEKVKKSAADSLQLAKETQDALSASKMTVTAENLQEAYEKILEENPDVETALSVVLKALEKVFSDVKMQVDIP